MAVFEVLTLTDSGVGSLRQAIADANAILGADTITFHSSVTGTIALSTGQIAITDSVTIDGPGAGLLSVSGNDASRVFYLYSPAAVPIDVTISGLTLADGRSDVSGDPTASRGGAINAIGENLTIEDSVVQDSAASGDGGGIASTGAALNVRNTIIRRNDALILTSTSPIAGQGGDGGGICANGSTGVLLDLVTLERNNAGFDGGAVQISSPQAGANILIVDSTLDTNMTGALHYSPPDPFPDHVGGGFSLESVPDFTIRRSTISGNVTNYGGAGGGRVVDSQGVIESSTFSSAYAQGPGGGLGAEDSVVTISDSTFVDNFVLGDPNTLGSGIHAIASTVNVSSSILANASTDTVTKDGATIALRYSYLRKSGTATIQDDGGNIINPPFTSVTGPLRNNGGPTKTHLPVGAVVNAGDPAFAPPPSTDQRGLPRIHGGRIDMGAVELHAGTIQFTTAASSVPENGGPIAVTLTRTGGTDGAVSVSVATTGATATSGDDFSTTSPSTVSWPADDATPQTKTISISDDAVYEGSETFLLQIVGSTGGAAVGTPAEHTVTITENDPPPADLSISKTIDEAGPYLAGQVITFNIVVTNAGPGDAADVVVTDLLPAGLTFVSSLPSGACSGAPALECSLGTIANGAAGALSIRTRLTAPGELTNTATVTSPTADADAGDNSDAVAFAVAASHAGVPALSATMQLLLAAAIAAVGLAITGRR